MSAMPTIAFPPDGALSALQGLVEQAVRDGARAVAIWAVDGNGC